ncbi:MAG: DEAD/DEAH box helicase [Crocinitomicaceae bacterium]|jgi:ATP-dependent RNA helicase RhlE
MKSFHDLNLSKQLLKALDEQGLSTPTTIQDKSFSVIMSGRDVVGIAQTGTGKTLAFLLPTLNMLKYSNQNDPRVIILVPTRELVLQVVEEIEKLTTYVSIRTLGIFGGANINTQIDQIMSGVDIIVATPGRFYDVILNGTLKTKMIQKLIIDEMDEMLNLGFRVQLKNILEVIPEKRQNLLFSATLDEEVESIIDDYFNTPERVEAAAPGTPVEKIRQSAFKIPNFLSKVNLIKHLFEKDETMNKVLVFTKSRKVADLLFDSINEYFPEDIGVIHSNKSQNYRFNSLKNFQDNKHRILIATDLVSRGLDISDVSHVINFDIPEDPTHYIHRIGRTGRADKEGIAISFISDLDVDLYAKIETTINSTISDTTIPEEVEITSALLEFEKPEVPGVNYLAKATLKNSQGAFHEKKEKNKKKNLGSKWKREQMKNKGKKKKR